MGESKATSTSEYIYEDEFSFLTHEHELFLKESTFLKKRKISEIEGKDADQQIQNLKEAFVPLKKKVEALENPDEKEIEFIRKELKSADAIGDFDALFHKLDKLDGKENVNAENNDVTNKPENEKVAEKQSEEKKAELKGQNVDDESSLDFYKKIVDKAEKLSKQDDWPYVSMELENLEREWNEGPELENDETKKLLEKFNQAVNYFEERKEEHYEKQRKQKKANLEKKKKLLAELKKVIEEEQWTSTGKVGRIKGKWNSTGMLPSGKGEDLDKKYEQYIETFNDHKVDRLVQKRQKEEDNLMLKLSILDKMENVASSIDENVESWAKLDEKFEDLTQQWKKVGRVPKEKSNEVWSRFKAAQDEYYDRKYKFDKKHKKQVDKFRSKKEHLCREAEALLEEEDLASAARKINKLHHRWKKVGNLPQRDEDKLWNRFKSATDEFNKRKSDNIEKLRKQEERHYKEKLKLIEEADSVKNTDDWDKGHQKMQQLMDQWKAIGPVPRKKSNKIWKQFKGAMDVFYERRRQHFKEQKKERKENLKEKKRILEELKELGQHENPIEAVEIAKTLQEKFKNVGYVPIKHKNEMWKQYREACDVIYDRFRAAKSGNKFDRELAKADLNPEDRSQIQGMRKQYKKIKKEVSKLESEVLQFKETKTYFKPSDKDNSLFEEVQQKIDKVENELREKQEKLEDLTRKMEEIREK